MFWLQMNTDHCETCQHEARLSIDNIIIIFIFLVVATQRVLGTVTVSPLAGRFSCRGGSLHSGLLSAAGLQA